MKKMIALSAVGALLVLPGLAGASARCDTKLLVYSGVSIPTAASVTYGGVPAVGCFAEEADADTRLIYGDTISIAFKTPYLRGRPFVMATVNGLGFRNERVFLIWDSEAENPDRYLSGFIPIPQGAAAEGCLSVSLKLTERRKGKTITSHRDATRYHTAGATC